MHKKVKPISPEEIKKNKIDFLPSEVIEVVNGILGRKYNGGYETIIDQEEVISGLISKGFQREDIFSKNMLDFEQAFRNEGWAVDFSKPAYNDTYKPHWVFKVKR